MSQPRRASLDQVEHGPVVDVQPRRGAGRGQRSSNGLAAFVKRAVAPAAVVGLMAATTALTFVPLGPERADMADPMPRAEVQLGLSRAYERPEVSSEVPLDTAVAAALNPVDSPVVEAEPTPTVDAAAAEVEAEPTPTPTETPVSEPEPTPDYSELGEEAGTRYAVSAVNVRTGPGKDFDAITSLAEGAKVTITDETVDGWQQIVRKGNAGWIRATYLDDEKPAEPASSSSGSSGSSASEGSSSSGGLDTSSCSGVAGIESGSTERTKKVMRALCNEFPNISSFGGARGGSGSYHNSGRAVDAMISGDAGWAVAKWARANASDLGIVEVLYSQKIWTSQRSGEGWRSFSDRGSNTANHYDHVHISVR